MKIIVIGSGLIGLTTAHALLGNGHQVTVVDRQAGPGLETSYANGALLTPSMAEPWNAPGCWRTILSSLGRSDAPMQLRLSALPGLARWGVDFLRSSTRDGFERSARANLRLALYSLEVMNALQDQLGFSFGQAARGSLRIFRDAASLDRAFAAANHRLSDSLQFRGLSTAETIALEPALAPIGERLAGAIYYEVDQIGDAYRFCVGLADEVRRLGAELRFATEATELVTESGRITAVKCGELRLTADRYVVAAGSYSPRLLKRAGVRLPVQPVKGYSVTFEDRGGRCGLKIPIVDDQLHAAVIPLEDALRVAGTAEFCGYDTTLNPKRIQNLQRLLTEVLPRAPLETSTAKPWSGLRPMSADGVPIIDATPLRDLYVNCGHGHLGWTLAAGSARLLSDLIDGRPTSIDSRPYASRRFVAAN